MASIVPQCPSMLIAHEVRMDPVSGLASILGVIHELRATGFPAIHRGVVAWAELTGGRGAADLSVTVLVLDSRTMEEHVMTTVHLQGDFSDPRRMYFVHVTIADIPLAKPGMLLFRLACGGVAIMERRVQISLAETEEGA